MALPVSPPSAEGAYSLSYTANMYLCTTVVGPDRADKLIGAIVKSASKEAGLSVPRSAFEMPTESDGQSKGFMFVTLANPTEAQQFQRALHDFKFDKRHTFRVVPFADVGNYEQLEETYVEPATEEWAPRVSPLQLSFGRAHLGAQHAHCLFPAAFSLSRRCTGALPRLARRPPWT